MELKTTLLQIKRDLNEKKIGAAQFKLKELIALVEHDKWLDDTEIRESAALSAFTSRPYNEITQSFSDAITNALTHAEQWTSPFPVRVMSQVLPPDLYQFVDNSFPMQRFLKPRKDKHFMRAGQFQRYETVINDAALAGAGHTVRKIWLGIAEAFQTAQVRHAMSEAIDLAIPASCRVDVRVMVDRCGFKMAPHTDGGNGGLLTFMMYLPPNGELSEHGTEFFRKDGDQFETVKKREMKPNTAHVFRITGDSWHGLMSPIPRLAEQRRSLVVRYMAPNAA